MSALPTIVLTDNGAGGEPAFRALVTGGDGAQLCYVDELGPDAVAAVEYLRHLIAIRFPDTVPE